MLNASLSLADDVLSSGYLIDNAKSLDGQAVRYRGEIVTAVLKRGSHAWINLNDGYNAIGVWCPVNMTRDIKYVGGYGICGDVLEVEGIFHRACPEHYGELDIHADSLKISRLGFTVSEKPNTQRLKIALALFVVVILLIPIFRKRI